jgi:hypothetical protein
MGKKRKRNKKSKTKPEHNEGYKARTEARHTRTMTSVLVYVLPIAAAVALAVAGMIYATQKVASIWLVFGAVVISALAACLYWQQAVITEADNPPFAVAIETSFVGILRHL